MSRYLNYLVNSTSKIETACREIRECASQLAVENPNSAEVKPVSGSLPPEAGIQQLRPKMPNEADFIAAATSKGVNGASAAWCYDYFVRHFGR